VSIAALADLTASVLDLYDITSADVVGFSYGGAVAQQFAYDHPDRIRRLVLAATTCGVGAVAGSLQAMAAFANTLRFHSPAYFHRVAPMLYGGVTGRDANARANEMIAYATSPPSSYGYAMQLLGAAGWTSLPFLDRIRHETLVINGDDDPLVPVANAHMLAERIPRARLEIVEQAGHMFLCDDAANLGPRIGRFVNAPPRAN
jgi:pimeloyl-ACP methyl ester carboxylesterase